MNIRYPIYEGVYRILTIDRACQLLLHTNMKINQVALKLGFDDPYYFSRIFKKIVGTSPKDYRHSLPK